MYYLWRHIALSRAQETTCLPGEAKCQEGMGDGDVLTIYNPPGDRHMDSAGLIQDLRRGHEMYNDGFAICTQYDTIELQADGSYFHGAVEDVAERLDPSSLTFECISDPDLKVFEQSFQFDAITRESLLDKYLDKEVELRSQNSLNKRIDGILKAYSPSFILQRPDGRIEIFPNDGDYTVTVPGIPEGLRTRPTLALKLWRPPRFSSLSPIEWRVDMKTTYKAEQFQWAADYNVVLNKENTKGALTAWVSIINGSGKSFKDATVKLVAGDVNMVDDQPSFGVYESRMRSIPDIEPPSMEASDFFEYHMYTLPYKTDVNHKALTQLTLFPTIEVDADKVLSYQGIYIGLPYDEKSANARPFHGKVNEDVDVNITLDHEQGVALPKGKVRVFQEIGGISEFVGEDVIGHTPRNAEVSLKLGKAFDVKGSRKVHLDVTPKTDGGHLIEETITVTIRNHKAEASAVVNIKEPLYRYGQFKVMAEGLDVDLESEFGHALFRVAVPADTERELTFTVVYDVPEGVKLFR